MPNYSKECKRQNEVLKDLISGKRTRKKYTQVGYEGKQENKGGETRKSELTDIMKTEEFLCFVLSVKNNEKKT